MKKEKIIIGRKDKADFPLLRLFNVDVKVDTGAYTSALHCSNIRVIKDNHNKAYVQFQFNHRKEFILPIHSQKTIKNSSGKSEHRYIIKTKIKLFNKRYPVELSLSDRSMMECPVLIGRKLLQGRFIVDVTKADLSHKDKMTRRKLKKL